MEMTLLGIFIKLSYKRYVWMPFLVSRAVSTIHHVSIFVGCCITVSFSFLYLPSAFFIHSNAPAMRGGPYFGSDVSTSDI